MCKNGKKKKEKKNTRKLPREVKATLSLQGKRKKEGEKNEVGSVGRRYLYRFENANNVERRGERAAA